MLQRIATRLTGLLVAAYLAYRVWLWRRYEQLMAKAGLPFVPLDDKRWFMRPFSNFFKQVRNWDRYYDMKLDNFNLLGASTIAVHPPSFRRFVLID